MRNELAQPARRAGFSLIELLVVILIISILVSLMVVGVRRFINVGPEVATRSQLTQIDQAIAAFKQHFDVDFLPNRFMLMGNYANAPVDDPDLTPAQDLQLRNDSVSYLKRLFPRMNLNATGLPNESIKGSQCLVFFLAGLNPLYEGFSTNPVSPFATGGTRMGPLLELKAANVNSQQQLVDGFGQPFIYYTAINRQYAATSTSSLNALYPIGTVTVQPYQELMGATWRTLNPTSYQLVSAGTNEKPGPGGQWRPGMGMYTEGADGADDLANFFPNQLGAP